MLSPALSLMMTSIDHVPLQVWLRKTISALYMGISKSILIDWFGADYSMVQPRHFHLFRDRT